MEGKVMKFGQFSKTNYSISLDMKSQLFIARSNDNPKFEASGITIQDALFALSKIDKNVKFWQLLKQEAGKKTLSQIEKPDHICNQLQIWSVFFRMQDWRTIDCYDENNQK